MRMQGTGSRVQAFAKRLLELRYLPAFLAMAAVLVMLPALKTGFVLDDLGQRAVELKPGHLPPRIYETGVPPDSGGLGTVLCDLFPGISRLALARNYGLLPWWAPDDLKLGLWRPVTAFTHWFDYRLFPDTPCLMHAENIGWFAAVVFFVAVIYRKLMRTEWAAGLAALLFLLDTNTYFPVMFIANRGFILSLFFGLMCFYEHHQWRSTKSRSALMLSALFLALSLFANEGGASTFAFILAYALVLESGSFRTRALTVLPSILVIVAWRTIYSFASSGVFHVGGYIDPANEPLLFAREVVPRAMVLLGGQLSGVVPEMLIAVNPSLQPAATVVYGTSVVAALMIFLPWIRQDKIAAFWLAVMLLAAIPAATVVPLSKNLGFVAVGAYGLIASFIAGLINRPKQLPRPLIWRFFAWIACLLLILIHVPGAIAGRVLTVRAINFGFNAMSYFINVDTSPDLENKNVIVVNAPCVLTLAYAPFYRAYHDQPLPKSIRTLVPGCTSFDVHRTDDRTLVVQSKAPNIFCCDDVGPIHFAYAFSFCNVGIGVPQCKKGDRHDLGCLTAVVLESDATHAASRVAFRFNSPLDSSDFHWFWFDWGTFSYRPFKVPRMGQSVTLPGPAG